MKPEEKSNNLLAITRSKAKMWELNVPVEYHIKIPQDPDTLFTLAIGMVGDLAAAINRNKSPYSIPEYYRFPPIFFDSYQQSKLNGSLDIYCELVGAAAFYLLDIPGSATVLSERLTDLSFYLDGVGLDALLVWLLQSDYAKQIALPDEDNPYAVTINEIISQIRAFFENGINERELLITIDKLRHEIYDTGTSRQLLFGDIVAAVVRKKISNSCRKMLPLYTGIDSDVWSKVIEKPTFIKELWAAQHLLGKQGIFQGRSAVIQMPTSAGKTKSAELVIRSAFFANRTNLAVVIAPFRSLCSEINNSFAVEFSGESIQIDELSDALQSDYDFSRLSNTKTILIATPEKFLYVLRHKQEITNQIGLVIFDEGHQFDNDSRGITYELLLTSLKGLLPEHAQKILISAVISNASKISEWLMGEESVVTGTDLLPTTKSLGFAKLDGRISYVDSKDINREEFWVPRVIEQETLAKRNRERKPRFFPDKSDKSSIALYLGARLVRNGGIAIFCGKKASVNTMCEHAIDCIRRESSLLNAILNHSDRMEVAKIQSLFAHNLGIESDLTQSAGYGVFAHHGNIPHGIRLAIEYATRENLIRFVICTSTLAQGVNLPIRYLIIAGIYPDRVPIKTRDFHNLIGRAGRAGWHTEGSIIFADTAILDTKKDQVKNILNPTNSEPCSSSLLSLVKTDNSQFVKDYVERQFSEPEYEKRTHLLCAVESFLLAHCDETDDGFSATNITEMAESTLAFSLANDAEKARITELFKILAENIKKKIPTPKTRKIFGRTLYGVKDISHINQWTQENKDALLTSTDENIFDVVWSIFPQYIRNEKFMDILNQKPAIAENIVKRWISGETFNAIYQFINESEYTPPRQLKLERIVEICESIIAYEGMLLIGAVIECLELIEEETFILSARLQTLQKRLKYGLPTESSIILYEMGFADRVLAQVIANELNLTAVTKSEIKRGLQNNRQATKQIIEAYPAYFQKQMESILDSQKTT